jgi:DNA polymerase I-like protein with 3'-5' exonuclease and polymerase domains
MVRVSHDPLQCRKALERTGAPVVLDLETTGLRRWNQIVSAGLLVDGIPYILFARSSHISVSNLPLADFRQALQPLERTDLIVVGHNALFDLGFLLREGVRVGGEVRDTLKLLRLLDQDRGGERGELEKRRPRRDLSAGDDAHMVLDYRLKHVAGQLLGIKMPHFPGSIELAPYKQHATYLACDLLGTKRLYDFLWPKLSPREQDYYRKLVAPMIPIMLDMTGIGVASDPGFIETESRRLEDLMKRLSEEHRASHGMPLGLDQGQMSNWLFRTLAVPIIKRQKGGVPSLDTKTLKALQEYTDDSRAKDSLRLIQDYRQATSLLVRLRSLEKHIDRQTRRIHSSFDDRQATGRVSSTYPNLQQLAKAKTISGEEFRSRNVLRATDGNELAVFDIGQADIRALAHAVESFPKSAGDYQKELREQRMDLLGPEIGSYYRQMKDQENPQFQGQRTQEADFDPTLPADLAEDFRRPGDFYTMVVQRILKRPPKDKQERNRFKAIILSIVNGLGPPSLARTLECTEQDAKGFLQAFDRAYPKVAAYKRLMNWQIAYTGQTSTFMGRVRTVTAHRWLVTEPRVEMLVSYSGGDAYWLDVVPLQPSRRVLTTFVRRAWNARTKWLIYESDRGRLSNRPYSLFNADELQYRLPIRNWGWRSIRRVRAQNQEADYEGFDATARSAFNFICQGGTADICKLMMLRARPVCEAFGARLLIQIHDELVFEVPKESTQDFLVKMKKVLEEPPVPGFKIPIVVEPKRGFTFGELKNL